jgi:hypothetical protein
MSIKIQLEVIKGDAELNFSSDDISVADLQASICNLELLKMNLLSQLANMTDVHKGEKEV